MAINIMYDNKLIICDKCGNKTFTKQEVFSLEEMETRKEKVYKKKKYKDRILCSECNNDVTNKVQYKIM